MPFSVTMPALGESVSEGTVTRWLKQEGDRVEADEPLLEVSTDKVDTEVPSPASGTLQRIVVAADETVDVGAELAVIALEDDASAPATPAAPAAPPAAEDAQAAYPAAPAGVPSPADQPEVSSGAGDEAQGAAAPGPTTATGTEVTLPALGESVTEGTVTRWLKQVGDTVAADEPLLEVSTDKVDTEVPSPASGTLLEIRVQADETVPVGAVVAVIGSAAPAAAPAPAAPAPAPAAAPAPAPAPAPAAAPAPAPAASPAPAPAPAPAAAPAPAPAPAPAAAPAPAPDAYVTPLVRKLAAEQGIDLATLTGTGVGGRIRKQDVLDAAAKKNAPAPAAPAAAPAAAAAVPAGQAGPAAPAAAAAVGGSAEPSPLRGTREKMTRLRKVIASRMVESLQTSAQLTTVVEVDVTRIARLRARAKRDFQSREGVNLSFLPFFAKATVEALKVHPKLNASIEGDEIVYHGAEHLGIAVDTERGLLVPVIHDAGDLNIGGLARKIADLAARTRDNKVTPDELGGGTFTLTNTGSRGALFDTPILNKPQVGILGTGGIVKRPVVVDDPELGETIAVRSMVYLALSYDHQLVDGADAARFLVAVKSRLEEGAFEADLGL
ncbi:2-oxoglutarate dehydrogenase E2 component [Motilibacter rhizosphaerae]|uniref:Dihydrolipoamide acetyltransferase component of pyruvate dehydrogenase complex n=1 Tax=Motilibacter rhizosphaerae TaxID=598652 RepID=A0A4Q7NRH4_9ACTN|nr:2-oxoglutarate dehydrogenase, E2 component, dihydrolipoamide succinyltransferase [Motilibacter rhizosphaerae]RZS89585.1 2-oxoglutarate dehydrogenase E2 component [Motilibacter rhizosphaerae]